MYFLFDFGGSKLRFTVTDNCVECTEPIIVKTPDTYEESLELIRATAKVIIGEQDIKGALGGVAGTFNKERSSLVFSPNNPDWVGKPLKADLEEILGVSVELENDTAVIALGEAMSGAGQGADIVAYMTVSTGVGGSRVVNGQMDIKARSFEPGHQIVDIEKGTTLEKLVSGTAVKERFGKEGYEIEDKETWSMLSEELAVGVHNTLLHWSPDVLVLGGSMITGNGPCFDMDELKENVEALSSLMQGCDIKRAKLGDLNGIHGALAWAKQMYGEK